MGIKFHDIYADQSGDKNKIYKLALEGKYDAIKQEHLNPIAIKFQEAVKANRPNLKEEPGVLTGKTFPADKAVEYGMIDSIGSMREAITMLQMMTELNQVIP
jgi:protease-4